LGSLKEPWGAEGSLGEPGMGMKDAKMRKRYDFEDKRRRKG
jgi:hypothetical protein